jgi:hypothetical protein
MALNISEAEKLAVIKLAARFRGQMGGSATTPKKMRSSRRNGRLSGGRKPKDLAAVV